MKLLKLFAIFSLLIILAACSFFDFEPEDRSNPFDPLFSGIKGYQKISDTEGGFTGTLEDSDSFGRSSVNIGDLNGDGITDLVVGAPADFDGGSGRGAVWILFLNSNGTVKSHQKISDTEGGFPGVLDDQDFFGVSASSIGDMNGDGITDLTIGAIYDDDGGTDRGAVWILFLNSDGTVLH